MNFTELNGHKGLGVRSRRRRSGRYCRLASGDIAIASALNEGG